MADWRPLERRPVNERLFARFEQPGHRWPGDGPRDPYMHAGSHPDVVEQVWDKLGPTLPEDCRFVVLWRPVLAHPRTGFVFALPFGTQYGLWIPKPEHTEAVAAGLGSLMTWSNRSLTDLEAELGEGWLFGKFLKQEEGWLAAAYEAAANADG